MIKKSKILIIGGTGYIGKFIVEASVKDGHPTFALIRENTTTHPEKSKLLDNFKSLGVTLIIGDIYDHEVLVNVIKQVDVVISTIRGESLGDQVKIISAIKEAGNVKRFLPSEFGPGGDIVDLVEPATSMFKTKEHIRRVIEAEGIPHTYVACNGFFGYLFANLGQVDTYDAPREKITILGDGNPKVIFVKEEEIALTTIKAIDNPRTLNKTLFFRPSANILSFNEIVSIWESKIGKTLEKTYIPEDQLLKNIQDAPFDVSIIWSIAYSIFVKRDASNFEMEPSFCEATELYPELKYTTIHEYLSQFV